VSLQNLPGEWPDPEVGAIHVAQPITNKAADRQVGGGRYSVSPERLGLGAGSHPGR